MKVASPSIKSNPISAAGLILMLAARRRTETKGQAERVFRRSASRCEFPFLCRKEEETKDSHKQNQKHMKKLKTWFNSMQLPHKVTACLAATATGATLILATGGYADPPPAQQLRPDLQEVSDILQKAKVAEIGQLLADFHGALSYGGNITAMMNLWADDSSITLNGVSHIGKPAVQDFFTSGGYFHNNWVSLAPEYKTQITINANRAEVSTQCVAVDLSATPHVTRPIIQVNAVAEKRDGKWVFISMNNTTPAPL